MGLASNELNSKSGYGFVQKSISEFLQEIAVIQENGKKLAKINGFVFELENEMKKIRVFKRELPVCMLLLGDAIEQLKEEGNRCKGRKGAMVEELIPSGRAKESIIDLNEKKNWMSSAQLWTPTAPVEYDDNCRNLRFKDSFFLYPNSMNQEIDNGIGKRTQLGSSWNVINNRGGAFVPFQGATIQGDDLVGNGLTLSQPVARMSSFGGGGTSSQQAILPEQKEQVQEKEQQQQRKQRRSWSPELHRRFVNALQQLGGPKVATPKQIRGLMQVADLTNDEVKSHLQKYRLHVRKMASMSGTSSSSLNLNIDDGLRRRYGMMNGENFKTTAQSSCSPEGPLSYMGGSSLSKGVSVSLTIAGTESFEEEEEDDTKSESYCWKLGNAAHRSR